MWAESDGDSLTQLTQKLREGVALLDPAGVILHWNLALEHRTGVPASQATGKLFTEMFRISGSGESQQCQAQDFLKLVPQHGELLRDLTAISGQTVAVRLMRLIGRSTDSCGFLCLDQEDFPAAAERQPPVAQARDLLTLFSECVLDYSLFTVDSEGLVVTWNRGAERMYGYRADDILGQSFEKFYPPEARARQDPTRDLAMARQNGSFDIEGWRQRMDGGLIGSNNVISVLRGPGGQLSGYAIVTRDITQQRRAYQELHDQRDRLRSIVSTAVDAIITIDDQGIVESFNPAAERLFGYRADEVIGENVNRLMPEPYSTEHTGYLQRYLRTGQARIIGIGREVQARRKDGSLFSADLAVSEFSDGRPLFTGIVRDLTERKQMEAAVLEIAEAEQRRIGQDLHDDTQQQLSGLTMIARHIADSFAPLAAGNPQLEGLQAKLERVVVGLRDANQSLRTLARGLVPLQVDAHGLSDALGSLAAQVRENHGIECLCRTDGETQFETGEIATHLYRIVQEAVNNALRHGQARAIEIRMQQTGRRFELEILDDGVGIGDSQGSVGRGLQIMAYRASLIGGILTVRRRETGGTIVACTLPLSS